MCQDVYFKTFVLPTHCPDLFAHHLLEFTKEAIEEIDSPPALDYHYFGNAPLALPSAGYVIYSKCSCEALLDHLKSLCCALAQRLGENVGFYHHSSAHPDLDWVQAYQESVKPLTCGQFYITPSWGACAPEGLVALLLDPALAFGTGRHESTRLLLQEISRLEVRGRLSLDVGCGSGILSLALAKKGAITHACDTDTQATTQTQANFARNGLECARLWEGSIDAIPPDTRYDLIAINIIASVIIQMHAGVLRASQEGSLLLLSGILDIYEDTLLNAYAQDFTLVRRTQENEWVSLVLCRHSNS
ncbi:50S ribosomal protein L11 methyltransferase [Helicobacter labacensis]|uniref:50S ribosomal protein L11 methyltransferase n=1 Tax=Helicobacter labacensis TaxID=2316079 RepID=UPI000EB22643|nr:50S ribosomal protein L11 methyltransferase [Helicobacter labacensis]